MDCARVIEKLSAYVDGLLDEQSLELVEKHIGLCGECARELESMRTLVRTAREIDLISPPVELRKRILDAVKQSKQQLRDCKLATEIMSAYIDGEADAQQESFLRNHISKCKECASELDSLRTLVKTTASIEPINPPRELKERISAAINAQSHPVKAFTIKLPSLKLVPVLRLAGGMVAAGIMFFTITAIMPRSPEPVVRVVNKSAVKKPAVIGSVPAAVAKPTVFNKMKPAAVASVTTVRWRTYRHATESKQSRVAVNSTAFVPKPVPKPVIEHPSSTEDVESSTGTVTVANEAASESIASANSEPAPKPQIEPENSGKPARGEVTVAAAFAEDAEQWIKRMKEEAALRKGTDRSCGISIFSARF